MFRAAILVMSASLLATPGCQKDDSSTATALKRIDDRLQKIEERLARGGPAGQVPGNRQARQRPPGPDPSKVYSVPIDGAPFKGAANAKITVVKAFEFACPYCMRVRGTLDQLLEQYEGDIKVVYKHLLVHPGSATIPAHAACAAHKQGKFAEMEEAIWERAFSEGRNLKKERMIELARDLGLDMDTFAADMNGDACKKRVAMDQQQLRKVGARGTPAFFINGRFISGARPIAQFKKVIDEELAKANARLEKGARADRYYAEWVLKKGKRSL